ncbi:MAG: gliding motility protein RemB, partial [Flavobacteriales bacterium]|nr:gliding motility protein RemB [Flavobacteriales bacterium]
YFRSFFDPSGYLSYSPSEHFNVQAGYDKLFFGNGYRSLLLSDNSNRYAFLKLDTRVWRIRYINVFANFKDIRPGAYRNKLGTFHYLSLNIAKRFNVGFFEAITWQSADSTGVRGFELNYINPIIFYRPIEFSVNSPDNVLMGFEFRYRIGKNNHLYGQLVLDEFLLGEVFASLKKDTNVQTGFWGNKQGFQVGIKGWNLLWIKDLYYQFEFNWVRPFTYTHVTIEQNYGHYNQPLAHPRGANFMESVNVLRYRKKNWLMEAKFIYSNFGLDTNSVSYGGDIYKSYLLRDGEYDHEMIQGLDTKAYLWQVKVEYVLNAFWDLRLMGGFTSRVEQSNLHRNEELYFFFGLSSDITRPFDDF